MQKSGLCHGTPMTIVKGGPASSRKSKYWESSSEKWSREEQERSKARHSNAITTAEDATCAKRVAEDATCAKCTTEDAIDEYRCLIVEEPPPSPNDT